MQITKHTAAVPEALAVEYTQFWRDTFDAPPQRYLPILRGDENSANTFHVYEARVDGQLAGTCTVTQTRMMPALGGLGEVATHPDFRRRGIARDLCRRARDDFKTEDGIAIYLATSNADAARGYRRLGWQRLPGTNVMLHMTDGSAPEAFHVDLFRRPFGRVAIQPLSADERLTMIPLLLTPMDDIVLDATAGFISIRHALQGSCMGLYPRYASLVDGSVAVFVARAEDGRALGIATAATDEQGACRIDAFTHPLADDVLPDLLETTHRSAAGRADNIYALLYTEDIAKQRRFESAGFRQTDATEPMMIGDDTVTMRRYTRPR